ncbi:MAG: hypothetical protein U0893_17545 [Chloroflexota bacterium]
MPVTPSEESREAVAADRPSALVPSRSLGPLLGLASLTFEVGGLAAERAREDRAAEVVVKARSEGVQALVTVGIEPRTTALAEQAGRSGLLLVVLDPLADDVPDHDARRGWLAALGARVIPVLASGDEVRAAAPEIVAAAGLRYVSTGLVAQESPHPPTPSHYRGRGGDNCPPSTVPAHRERGLGGEGRRVAVPLTVLSSEPSELPRLVFGGVRVDTIVGSLGGAVDLAPDDGVLRASVTPRDADAARTLLAREEGLLVSRPGAAGFAALLGVLRADRGRKPRERQVDPERHVVVVLAGEPCEGGGEPPLAADRLPVRPVPLAELASSLRAVLVEPPGRVTQAD